MNLVFSKGDWFYIFASECIIYRVSIPLLLLVVSFIIKWHLYMYINIKFMAIVFVVNIYV